MNTFRILAAVVLVAVAACGSGCGSRDVADARQAGLAALQRNRFGRAERLLRQAAAEHPEDVSLAVSLATAQWKNGSLSEAIASLRQAAILAPDDLRIQEYLGLLLLHAGQDHAALLILDKLASERPESAQPVTAVAVARWRLGDTATAADLLAAVLESHPDYPPAIYNMAVFQRDQRRDIDQARLFFERYLDLAPAGGRVAEARRALSRLDRADSEARNRRDRPLRSPFESTSPRLLHRAQAAVQRGDYDEAYVHLRTAVRNDENDPHALWTLAEFLEKQLQNPSLAALTWQDFVNRFPEDPRSNEARQRLRRLSPAVEPVLQSGFEPGNQDPSGARLIFNPLPRRDTEGARRSFEQGMQFQRTGDWNRAIYHFSHAVEQDDSQVNALIQLARAFENSGDLPRAVDACEYALRLRPDLNDLRMQAARLLIRLREHQRAAAQLQALLHNDPEHAGANLLLGLLWRHDDGMRNAARRHLERYLVLEPDGENAPRVRLWLDNWEG